MLLEDRNELVTDRFNQLIKFIKKIETDNYCDPEQFSNAQKLLNTLINELYLLGFKLDYLNYGYSTDFLEEAI